MPTPGEAEMIEGGQKIMCQGCEDMMEWDRMLDQIVHEQVADILARPLDDAAIYGPTT